MADELTIKVVSNTSDSLQVHVHLASASVLTLKQLIEQQDAHRFPVAAQRLIFQGQILQDAKLLTEYHVTAGCALHLTLTPNSTATAAAAATAATFAPPSQLTTFLQQMRDGESREAYATAVRTLEKICSNIVDHPNEEKYRKLRVDNAALRAKLFDRTRGLDSVDLLGFQDGVLAGHLVLVPTPEKWEHLVACKSVLDSAASALAGHAASAAASGVTALLPSTEAGGSFAAQAQTLLQNPAMVQSMASHPLVQQLSQQNPMLAQALQNPALLAQSMQALQQNPAMMQEMSQMMSDPNAMARMQQLMAGSVMGGLGGGFASSSGAASASAGANPFAAFSGTVNPFASSVPLTPSEASTPSIAPAEVASTALTPPVTVENDTYDEDEMANAIARSLQDQ